MQVTTTNLALKRLLWIVISAVITGVLAWATQEYGTAAFFPLIYFALTTARDYFDKTIPNK